MTLDFKNILFMMITIIFFVISCNEKEMVPVYNPKLVFPETLEISIPEYSYSDNEEGKVYHVVEETFPDTVSSTPVFQWENISNGIYSVVISTEPFKVKNGSMVNFETIIWQWHNTMEVKEGINTLIVRYLDGRSVINFVENGVTKKKIFYDTQPLPLESGLYFWMVWGWDGTGRRVLFSSKQKSFLVE